MDKIIKTTLGIFIIILVAFVAIGTYSAYIDSAYKNSISGNYLYTCTISTTDVLSNVTLFVPVPENAYGASPVISKISDKSVSGVPNGWNLTLFDTGKATLLQISAKTVGLPKTNGISPASPIILSVNVSFPYPINTQQPIDKAAVFRPVQGLKNTSCPASNVNSENNPICFDYQTTAYADYTSAPSTIVIISESVVGTNSWKIFSPESNTFINQITFPTLHGSNQGWITAQGWIEAGVGSYSKPSIL